MCNLQDLTLYIQIKERNRLVNGIQLENNVLIHLSKFQTFVFYICTFTSGNHTVTSLSNDDIQRTFSHVKFGQAGCSISHFNEFDITYNVFSLPFKFERMEYTRMLLFLCIYDTIVFKHEYFVRLARCFPLLEALFITNC
ncbi:unnamed protein product [Rotaria magnacalcarata]